MAAPAWIEPFLTWLTSNPITTTALRRIEGNTKHLRDGDTVFSGTKQFTNNVEMLSQLIVRAETILREIVQISGSLSMLGNMTVDPRPGFGGTGNVTISSGNVQLSSGNLTVTSGNASIGGNATVSGGLTVTGAISGASIDTGNGAVELNQNLRTTDVPTFPRINLSTMGTRTFSSVSVAAQAQEVFPAGRYYYNYIGGNASFQVRSSDNTWRTIGDDNLNRLGGYVISDGSNVRISNVSTTVSGTLDFILVT